jgi:O-antigen ligase/tetratricopeptide (TPR) repeat protein
MNLEKILKYIVYGGLFLIPFVPFYVANTMFFPFITGKALLFRVLVEVSFGAWLSLSILNREYRPKKSWLFYAINIFVGLIALSDILGGNFSRSFWSNFERMEGLVTLLHLLAYFYVLTSFMKTEKVWDRLIQTSIGASLIIGGRGFLQLFGLYVTTQSGSRLDATFGNASYLAVYMLFHVFLTAYLLSKHQGGKFIKWIYGLIIAFQAFILIFTATRGTILALFGATALTLILVAIFEKEQLKFKKISIALLAGLVLITGLFFVIKDSSIVARIEPLRRMAEISLTDRTTTSRFLIWDMAYQGFKERPILGWGQENFLKVFDKYYNPAMYAQEPWFDRAHNIFFDWLIAGGVLGLLAYLSLFILSFYSLWKSQSLSVIQKSLFVSLLAGYFVHNIFVFDNIGSYILFIITLALIDFHSKSGDEESLESNHSEPSYARVLVLFVGIFMIFSIYFFNAKGVLAARKLIFAISPHPSGPIQNLEFFKEAVSYDSYGNQEIRERLITTTTNILNADIPQETKEAFVVLARGEMQKELDNNPESARLQVFMGGFLNRLGLYNDALLYLDNAKKLSPRKQQIYFEYVTNYLSSNQLEKALESAKVAYELDKNFDNARIIYVVTLIYNRNISLAEEIIEEQYGEKIIADERLAQAYFQTGNFNKTILIWDKLIEAEPRNTRLRTSLAATYLEVGNRVGAVEEIKKAIEIDPNFQEQGEFFIREIEAGRNP